RCMANAIKTIKTPVTYINTHGTSTPAGDITELDAIREVFDRTEQDMPHISSTKSMTGHSLGATGVQEAIYSLLMMKHDFVAPSINIETLDPGAGNMPIARKLIEGVKHQTVMSNSFGFGGTNCTLAMSRYEG
ncbi:MAG TPA: beta-ketoacyl-ACP synthase I, partial [Micavibrio sp.]